MLHLLTPDSLPKPCNFHSVIRKDFIAENEPVAVFSKKIRRLFSMLHLCFHISPKVRAFLNVFFASRIFKREKKREITRFLRASGKNCEEGMQKYANVFCVFLKRHMVFEIKTSSWSIFAKLRLFSTLFVHFPQLCLFTVH